MVFLEREYGFYAETRIFYKNIDSLFRIRYTLAREVLLCRTG
jgi:hypothetical protein